MTGAPAASVLWRRLDAPGHDASWIVFDASRWHLGGASVFAHDEQPCHLAYEIVCGEDWRTRSATISGWIGARPVRVAITVDAAGEWRLDGAECPGVVRCLDIDLNWSPSTNLLPIRRLALAVGEEARVRAAWLRFPSLRLEPLDQVYRRTDASTYRYESAGGQFVRDLTVNEAGFVTLYPDFFEAEATV